MSEHEDWSGLEIDGRYRVERVLGRGGMGVVYRAQDLRLDSPVVVKAPHRHLLDSPEAARRFRREVQALVRLSQKHVVRIQDVGEHNGLPYAVMQFLGGGSLEDRLVAGGGKVQPLPPESLRGWLPDMAEALDYLHAQGFLHRDVKPGNILFDEHGRAYLGDFGIVKALAEQQGAAADRRDSRLTELGTFVGTAAYLAPEVVLGGPLDGRVDQYSLAVTVYEALSGALPVQAPTPHALLGLKAVIPPQPLARIRSDLPAALCAAVDRGLARDPGLRFARCADLAAAVLSALAPAAPAVRRGDTRPLPTSPMPAPVGYSAAVGDAAEPLAAELVDPAPAAPAVWPASTPFAASPAARPAEPPARPWETTPAARQPTAPGRGEPTAPLSRPPQPGLPLAWRLGLLGAGAGAILLLVSLVCAGGIAALAGFGDGFLPWSTARQEEKPRPKDPGAAPPPEEPPAEVVPPIDPPAEQPPEKPPAEQPAEGKPTEEPPASPELDPSLPPPTPEEPAEPLLAPFSAQEADAARQAWAAHLQTAPFLTTSVGSRLALIPPGEFLMGASVTEANTSVNEQPPHRVRLTRAFYAGVHEVTQGEWEGLMGTRPWDGEDCVRLGDDYPATYVTWDDAQAFVAALAAREGQPYRLLTEAEWEWMCRAGTVTAFFFGDDGAQLEEFGWYEANADYADEDYAHQVGQKRPNPFGLYDVHGNVREWCQDRYAEDYYGTFSGLGVDPLGPAEGSSRVTRGGSWYISAAVCRSAARYGFDPTSRDDYLGFRIALTAPGQ